MKKQYIVMEADEKCALLAGNFYPFSLAQITFEELGKKVKVGDSLNKNEIPAYYFKIN
jgi:hypothetical protein